MRRKDAVAESASRRLAELAVRLERAGVPRAEPDGVAPRDVPGLDDGTGEPMVLGDPAVVEPVAGLGPAVVREPAVAAAPGRHAGGRSRARAPVADWLADRMPPWLLGRVSLGGGHVAVLAAVAVAAVGLTAWFLHRPSAPVERVAVPSASGPALVTPVAGISTPTGSTGALDTGVPGTGTSGSGAAGAGSPGTVVVDVAGKVRRPGVLTLPAGSRVTDAIRQAGGPRPGVSLTSLNLARVLVDGEQILVGLAPAGGVAAPAAGAPSAGGSGPLVNLNTATLAELDTLPGVGPVTAQRILDWRGSHGAFTSVDELLEIDGIGEKTLAQMASRVTL